MVQCSSNNRQCPTLATAQQSQSLAIKLIDRIDIVDGPKATQVYPLIVIIVFVIQVKRGVVVQCPGIEIVVNAVGHVDRNTMYTYLQHNNAAFCQVHSSFVSSYTSTGHFQHSGVFAGFYRNTQHTEY